MLRRILNRKESEDGFSLIELIVVVAILGILVAIAIPVYGHIERTTRFNAMEQTAQNGVKAITALQASGGVIVDPVSDLESPGLTGMNADGTNEIILQSSNRRTVWAYRFGHPGDLQPDSYSLNVFDIDTGNRIEVTKDTITGEVTTNKFLYR